MKKSLISVLTVLLVLAMTLSVVVACTENEPETYTVTFKNGEETVSAVKVEEGQTLTKGQIPQDPIAPQGQKFDGWYVGQTKVEAGYKPTDNVTATAKFVDDAVTPNTYTVTFKNGNDTVKTVQVNEGEALTAEQLPSDPTAPQGQKFDGWYVDETKVEAGYKPTDNVTATAKFSTTTIKYAVTFDLGSYDGSEPVPAPVEVDADTEYYPKAPNVAFGGKTFVGWKLSDSTDGAIFNEETPVTVTSDITLVAQWQGIERGNYIYTHFYTGNGKSVLYLDGNGGGRYYEDVTLGSYETITYTFDYTTSVGNAIFEDETDNFRFELVSVSEQLYYIVYDEYSDGEFTGNGSEKFVGDGFMDATYTDSQGGEHTGRYAQWEGYLYFYPGGGERWVFASAKGDESNTLTRVQYVFFLNNTSSKIQLVLTGDNNAYLVDSGKHYSGTIPAEIDENGELDSVFTSDDGQHTFDFRANTETDLFTKKYDITGSYLLTNDSWQILGDYVLNFYSGYNGGSVSILSSDYQYVSAGTYALQDKDNLLWKITLFSPIDLKGKGSASELTIYIENETGGDSKYAVVYNDSIVGKTYVSSDYSTMIAFFGNGRGYWSNDYGTTKNMMVYGWIADDFGYYTYYDESANLVEKQFHIINDSGYMITFEWIDTSSAKYERLYGTYYNTTDINKKIIVDRDIIFGNTYNCPWILSEGGTYFTVYVIEKDGFYTAKRVDISGDNLTCEGETYSKNFDKTVTLANNKGWTVEFNAKDLERNPAGFTIAPIKFNGQESNLYFGYYTVGSEQYGNLRYSWYIGFYVDLTSGAGQVFLRFEVTTDIDPKTLDGTQFEFADSEDDKKTLYVGADGSMIIFDGRFNDTFNGMLYIDSQGAVKIGTWSESGGHYVFDELDGEFTVTFDANSDDGTYTVV